MASSPFPVYLHFQTKVTRLVLQVITAFGSQLVSVDIGELKHNIGPVHIPFTFQHENLCWTVIKMKKKTFMLAFIEDTIISSIRIPKLLNPVLAHMRIRIRIMLFSSVTFKTPTKN
jgi:hypothetical protein